MDLHHPCISRDRIRYQVVVGIADRDMDVKSNSTVFFTIRCDRLFLACVYVDEARRLGPQRQLAQHPAQSVQITKEQYCRVLLDPIISGADES